MKRLKRALVMLLAVAMLLNLVACGLFKKEDTAATDKDAYTGETNGANAVEMSLPVDNTDRESLEQIAEMLGGTDSSKKFEDLDDDELTELIEDMIEQGDIGSASRDEVVEDEQNATETLPEGYKEDGTLEKPFDEIFPEVIEEGTVEYDEETILIKMDNSREGAISDGMKKAGVAALEPIVPMEDSTWYEAKLKKNTDVNAAVEALRALSEVLMVDYNYTVQTSAISEAEAVPESWHGNQHYGNQWHLRYCGISKSHETQQKNPGGSPSVVVAVIDTGVDYDHEDLKDNIWINSGETPNDGIDNDGNGYIDDYYGVDVISGEGNGDDDNGHGTHVAGIIAAQNNNLGVVGIAYNCKIMPIKAGMASGYFNQSDIAKAIIYAYENGAEVINMSFGGNAVSIAVQDALEVAYTRCVLVAAAGNDTVINESAPGSKLAIIPCYPAALPYVLGVMSVNQSGVESGFTNVDGKAFTGMEYELYAPGEAMMSTIPNDGYASWSGTSMAAPVVSAMAAILRSEYSDRDAYPTKFIYGQLASTSGDTAICADPDSHGDHNLPMIANLYDALNDLPKPEVGLNDYTLFDTEGMTKDTAKKNNGDGRIDAGETIALGLTLRNRWGMSKDTMVTIDTLSQAGIADPYITILNDTVDYGSVGTYTTGDCGAIYEDKVLVGWENPFYIKIAENCPNDYIFTLNVTIRCGNGVDENDTTEYGSDGKISLEVRNGTVLPQIISKDMTLTKENLYIIENSTVIQEGATVTVEPGTHIQFWSNDPEDPYADSNVAILLVEGNFYVDGSQEEPVYIYPSDLFWNYSVNIHADNKGFVSLNNADITNFIYADGYVTGTGIQRAKNVIFRWNVPNDVTYRHRTFEDGGVWDRDGVGGDIEIDYADGCVFYHYQMVWENKTNFNGIYNNCLFVENYIASDGDEVFRDCVFLNNSYNRFIVRDNNDDRLNDVEIYKTYYYPDNGSTYVTIWSPMFNDAFDAYIRELGGDYMAAETEKEFNWIKANVLPEAVKDQDGSSSTCKVDAGIRYDLDQKTYTWANGVPVGSFADPKGLQKSGSRASVMLDEKGIVQSDSGYRYLYEIPGPIYPTGITFDTYELMMEPEDTYQLHPIVTPASDDLIYESRNKKVVTVDENGLITAVGLGATDVFVYSFDKGTYNHVYVTVKDTVELESIELNEESVALYTGETFRLFHTLYPSDATRNKVTYTSSDSAVATVGETGVITAVGSGVAKITVASVENPNINDTVEVQVKHKATALDFVSETGVLILSLEEAAYPFPEFMVSEGADVSLNCVSTDPTVLTVDCRESETAESLKVAIMGVHSAGTTNLIIYDTESGLSTSLLVYVVEGELPTVKKMVSTSYFDTVLTADGKLYRIERANNEIKGICICEDVVDFDAQNNGALILKETGEFYRVGYYDNSASYETDFFVGKNIVDFTTKFGNSFFVVTDQGTYSWGSNDKGLLGLGHTDWVSTPGLINIEDVTSVCATSNGDYAVYLTQTGELYASGGDIQAMLPQLIATDVESAYVDDHYGCIFYFSGENRYKINWDLSTEQCYDYVAGYDAYSGGYAVKSGELYKYNSNTYEKVEVPGVVTHISACGDRLYVATDDAMVYSYVNNAFVPVVLFTVPDDMLSMKSHNLDEKTVTDGDVSETIYYAGDSVELAFDKVLSSHSPMVYTIENGVESQIPVTISSEYNVLRFTRTMGFEKDVEYHIAIPAGGVKSDTGLTNAEQIDIYFTGTNVPMEDLQISMEDMLNGSVEELNVTVTPVDATRGKAVYKSSDPSVVHVDADGTLYALKAGSAVITMTERGFVRETTVEVYNPVTSIDIAEEELTVSIAGSSSVDLPAVTANADSRPVYDWTSIDTTVAELRTTTIKDEETGTETKVRYLHLNACGTTTLVVTEESSGLQDTILVKVTDENGNLPAEDLILLENNIAEQEVKDEAGEVIGTELVTDSYKLVLKFNKALDHAKVSLDVVDEAAAIAEDDEENVEVSPIESSAVIENNVLEITHNGSLLSGNTYHLVIEAGNLTGAAGVTNSQTYEYVFRTTNNKVHIAYPPTCEPFGSRLDSSVERLYWDAEMVRDRVVELRETLNINPGFYGNVILNPVATNTNVDEWLRIKAEGSSGQEVPIGRNYWDTQNSKGIELQMIDYRDYVDYALFDYEGWLTEAPEAAYPFVTNITVLNKDGEEVTEVSNEEITVRVTFNRDMNTSEPLRVTFGSAEPYGDYEINGAFVNARTWEGTQLLTTVIENGTQYFRVENGESAVGNLPLWKDEARYSFVLDTSSAQAMIMQGYATDTGIQLSWTQDDFNILMGYNVYRSTSEDGYYQRLNSTVIPFTTTKFFDDTVEPGVMYYYNFTVVTTSLKESIPSGKIALMSKDTMAPDIYHTPVYTAYTGSNLVITATVTDNLAVSTVKLYYRTCGTDTWRVAVMNKLNDKFSAIISASDVTTDGIEYYIEATDGISSTLKGSAKNPYVITVTNATVSNRGDVNGDGKISNLDALMILQAINDLLNLSAEQFDRADLNGDGELSAAEALRVLHYVSGKVGSLTMD